MTKNVLFLCTGNSARSIMAEAYFNHASKNHPRGPWHAYSAGSRPVGAPNPFALRTLAQQDIDAGTPRSKSWDEFASDDAPVMSFVITVCDNAAGETCPVWPRVGSTPPRTLHWSFPDPAAATGTDADISASFDSIFSDIRARIDDFLTDQMTE